MTLEQEVAKLRAENETMRAKLETKRKLALKVSEKGGLSVYGLGRFPLTLYKSQWLRLIEAIELIKSFLSEHNAELIDQKEAA